MTKKDRNNFAMDSELAGTSPFIWLSKVTSNMLVLKLINNNKKYEEIE